MMSFWQCGAVAAWFAIALGLLLSERRKALGVLIIGLWCWYGVSVALRSEPKHAGAASSNEPPVSGARSAPAREPPQGAVGAADARGRNPQRGQP